MPGLPSGYQQHKAINVYYKRLGADRADQVLVEEVADNQANEHEALKFGNDSHLNASPADVTPGRGERDGLPARPCRSAGRRQWKAHQPT